MNVDRDPLPGDFPGAERVSTGALPSDTEVQALISAGYERYRHLEEGAVADYIPALAAASPSAFGVCVAGVRGRLFSVGDADQEFAIESVSKLFVFALVCHTLGHEEARRKLGVNSTGLPFNSVMAIELNADRSTTWVSPVKAGSPEASLLCRRARGASARSPRPLMRPATACEDNASPGTSQKRWASTCLPLLPLPYYHPKAFPGPLARMVAAG